MAGVLIQVILPYSGERHGARVLSIAATVAVIMIGQVAIQLGLVQRRRQLRREHEVRRAESDSVDEFGID